MPLLTLAFDEDPLFAIAFHPEKREFVLGFATGQVTAYSYPAEAEAEAAGEDPEDPEGSDSDAAETDETAGAAAVAAAAPAAVPKQLWTTKRHKASCRALAYSQDGATIFSAGSDNVVKAAASATGKVTAKARTQAPASAIAVNDTFLAVGDDDGALTVFALDTLAQKYRLEHVHTDAVAAVLPLEHKNKYHFATAGTTTLVHVDVRRGVLTTSEDQEDELLAGCVASERHSVFGMAEGVLTVWNNNHLLDQQSRVRLTKDTVDAVIAGEHDDTVVAGAGDGKVYEVDVRSGKITATRTHDKAEEVQLLDWDCEYRLASGSLSKLVLWRKGEVDAPANPGKANPGKAKGKTKNKKRQAAAPEPPAKRMFADL